MKNLTYFVRLLPVACFCDSFETWIMNILRATDIPFCFLSVSVFWLFYFLEYFNITKRFQKHEFCCILFRLVTLIKISAIFRSFPGS